MRNLLVSLLLSWSGIYLHAATPSPNRPPGTIIISNTAIDQSFVDGATWPVTIMNDVAVSLAENITLNQSSQYFIIGGDNVTFDGLNQMVTLNSITDYPGLFQNGDNSTSGFNNIMVRNIPVFSNASTLLSDGGWVGQTFFGSNTTSDSINYCNSNGDIPDLCGGIAGASAKIWAIAQAVFLAIMDPVPPPVVTVPGAFTPMVEASWGWELPETRLIVIAREI